MPHFNLPNHPRTPYLKLILVYIFMARDENFSLPPMPVHMANEVDFFSSAQAAIDKATTLIKNITVHKLQAVAEIIVQENLASDYQLKNYVTLAQIIIEKFADKIKNPTDHPGIKDEIELYEKRILHKPTVNIELTRKLVSSLTIVDPRTPPVEIFTTLLELTRQHYPLLKTAIIEVLKPFVQTSTDIATLLNQETTVASIDTSTPPSLTPFFSTPPNTGSTGTQPLDEPPKLKHTSKLSLTYSSE